MLMPTEAMTDVVLRGERALYPAFQQDTEPMTAAAAMALASLSVVANANRLCGFTPPRVHDVADIRATDPVVEVGGDEEEEITMSETLA